jgi:hypothetical protein
MMTLTQTGVSAHTGFTELTYTNSKKKNETKQKK